MPPSLLNLGEWSLGLPRDAGGCDPQGDCGSSSGHGGPLSTKAARGLSESCGTSQRRSTVSALATTPVAAEGVRHDRNS